jgi:two-component system, chemotaxis family, response regulator Rcp1
MPATLDIMLVEDNEGDVELAQRALRTAEPPCRISVAHNGHKALDLLQSKMADEDENLPQLILLDINMPGMDGKQFLTEIKTRDTFKAIPVVMFTSSQSPTDIRECYERQASCYVVKPFDAREYGGVLREVVSFWGKVGELP